MAVGVDERNGVGVGVQVAVETGWVGRRAGVRIEAGERAGVRAVRPGAHDVQRVRARARNVGIRRRGEIDQPAEPRRQR